VQRVLSDPGFGDDTGAAHPGLTAALRAWAGTGVDEVPAALLTGRVLVPIVAIHTASEPPATFAMPAGAVSGEKSTDMAVVTIRGHDGRVALPAFTSTDALTAWHPEARPLPITGARACEAALFEDADLLVLDPAGPVTYLVAGPTLRALAAGRLPVPVHADPEVAEALREHLRDVPGLAAAVLLPDASVADSDGVLALLPTSHDPGFAPTDLAAALAGDPMLRDRLGRGLDLAVLPAGATLPEGVRLR
jgi:hypothetical protein